MKQLSINLVALILAIAISWLVLNNYSVLNNDPAAPINKEKQFYTSYADNLTGELKVKKAFSNEKEIVLFGSSELTGKDIDRIKPHHFIEDHSNLKLLSIGHAGNQCFSIFSQLLANHDRLKGSKIVIIISPGWFTNGYEKGTSIQSFFEYSNERALLSIYQNKAIPTFYKQYVGNYIYKNFNDINTPSPIVKAFYYNYSIYNKIRYGHANALNNYMLNLRAEAIKFKPPEELSNKIRSINSKINWDSLFNYAKSKHLQHSTNNNWSIENSYYTDFVKGEKYNQEVNFKANQELNDFMVLAKYLKEVDASPLFIITPLNPYAYNGLEDVSKIITKITNNLNKNELDYYNMYIKNTEEYDKGLLKDVMHLGDYGWLKINKKIIEKYVTK